MIRVTHETAIGAPPDHIWATATDIERWPDWLPTMSAARKLSPGPFVPGSRFELKQPLQPAAIREVRFTRDTSASTGGVSLAAC